MLRGERSDKVPDLADLQAIDVHILVIFSVCQKSCFPLDWSPVFTEPLCGHLDTLCSVFLLLHVILAFNKGLSVVLVAKNAVICILGLAFERIGHLVIGLHTCCTYLIQHRPQKKHLAKGFDTAEDQVGLIDRRPRIRNYVGRAQRSQASDLGAVFETLTRATQRRPTADIISQVVLTCDSNDIAAPRLANHDLASHRHHIQSTQRQPPDSKTSSTVMRRSLETTARFSTTFPTSTTRRPAV
mmetsp:Transcript_9978/g.30463  ORF Transcript_9978/g.30463 Transcript_9978/m.30463 type:complete len:242 (-) Transcript_9978:18-743(-)